MKTSKTLATHVKNKHSEQDKTAYAVCGKIVLDKTLEKAPVGHAHVRQRKKVSVWGLSKRIPRQIQTRPTRKHPPHKMRPFLKENKECGKVHRCKKCHLEMKTSKTLATHVKNKHSEQEKTACVVCGKCAVTR